MNSYSTNIFSQGNTGSVDIFGGATAGEEVSIFATTADTTVDIFGNNNSDAENNVDIFSNNARGPAEAVSPSIDIFSQENTPEVNIFGDEEVNIFSETSNEINIFSEEVSQEVDIFASDDTDNLSVKFEDVISNLNSEGLPRIAAIVRNASDLYIHGV